MDYRVNTNARVATKVEMWELILKSLELLLPKSSHLTPREREVMAHILVRPHGMDCFHGTPGMALRKQLGITLFNLSTLRKQLMDKDWIDESDMPERKVAAIQKNIQERQADVIEINMKIRLDGNTGQ